MLLPMVRTTLVNECVDMVWPNQFGVGAVVGPSYLLKHFRFGLLAVRID